MSDRNNTMLAIITVAIVLCGTMLTAVYVFGQLDFNWNIPDYEGLDPNANEYSFTFEEVSLSIDPVIAINIGIDVGGVNILFEENSTLVYRLDLIVSNDTYKDYGAPNPQFNSPSLNFNYAIIEANLTLGSEAFYTFDISIDVGSVNVDAGDFAHVSNVDIEVDVGSITFALLEDFTLDGNVTVDLDLGVGSMDLIVGLPANIGGRVTGSTATGDFDIYSFDWDEITENRYETTNYSTADQTITFTSDVDVGEQVIVLNQ
ncbi:MAG: hypothetical protein ACTSUB_08620 [Candidatus Thorarchaeota archaeon]